MYRTARHTNGHTISQTPAPGPTNAHRPHVGKLRVPLPGHHVHEERGDEHVVERLGNRLPHVEVVVPLNAPRAPPATPVPQRRGGGTGSSGTKETGQRKDRQPLAAKSILDSTVLLTKCFVADIMGLEASSNQISNSKTKGHGGGGGGRA